MKVYFSPEFEIVFDTYGVNVVQSGTGPHNPEQVRLTIRNAQISDRSLDPGSASREMSEAVSKLIDEGGTEDQLREFILNRVTFDERLSENSVV